MMHCSVIIPHLNQTDHLRKCINALSEQESDGINFEIIVVDNGSSDGSVEMLKQRRLERFTKKCAKQCGAPHETPAQQPLPDSCCQTRGGGYKGRQSK